MEDGDFLICHANIVSMSNCQLRVMYLLKLRLCYPPQVFKIICLSKLISYDLYSWVDLRRLAHTPLYEKVNLLILYFDVFSRILLLNIACFHRDIVFFQTEAGRLQLEGCLCDEYFKVRELGQFAVVWTTRQLSHIHCIFNNFNP